MTDQVSRDRQYMLGALALGARGLGTTGANPSVGCIIVDGRAGSERVVGRGWTARGGRPHAETVALGRAGPLTRSSTVYVTLEPCAHHGETPPCCDALVEAGVGRVVVALRDPDPRVSGGGIARIEAAGIAVETGICADEAFRLHAGFLSRIVLGRPRVLLKLAVSADGMIAVAEDNRPNEITGPVARRFGHMLRARYDAIIVGRGTVEADDPQLTCRIDGLEDRSPIRIVLDSSASISPTSRLVRSAEAVPLWILHGSAADAGKIEALEALHATTVETAIGDDGRVELAQALRLLGLRGLNSVMVEGGAAVARALLDADLVDEVAVFRSPDEIGSHGVPAFAGSTAPEVFHQAGFVETGQMPLGPDTLFTYEKTRKEFTQG